MARTAFILVALVWLLVLSACVASLPQPIDLLRLTPASAAPTPEFDLGTMSELCEWYVRANLLRGDRIGKVVGITNWLLKYGTAGAPQPDEAALEEFASLLREYMPHDQRFVAEWTKLGSPPEGRAFWEAELAAVQLRAQAFEAMLKGIDEGDPDEFERGSRLFSEATVLGTNAESEMWKVRSQCLPTP
jgi:hypothetical protein